MSSVAKEMLFMSARALSSRRPPVATATGNLLRAGRCRSVATE